MNTVCMLIYHQAPTIYLVLDCIFVENLLRKEQSPMDIKLSKAFVNCDFTYLTNPSDHGLGHSNIAVMCDEVYYPSGLGMWRVFGHDCQLLSTGSHEATYEE